SAACALAKAIDSEIRRPRGAFAGRTTATGRESLSMTTSAPLHTRSRSNGRMFAASESETQITCLGIVLIMLPKGRARTSHLAACRGAGKKPVARVPATAAVDRQHRVTSRIDGEG